MAAGALSFWPVGHMAEGLIHIHVPVDSFTFMLINIHATVDQIIFKLINMLFGPPDIVINLALSICVYIYIYTYTHRQINSMPPSRFRWQIFAF